MSATTPVRKPRKAIVIAVIVVAALAVIAVALWAVEAWARQQVADYVTAKVREVLSLESDHPVSVEIAGFSVVGQAVTGTLEQIDVQVDDVRLGELSGGIALTARGIPVDMSKPVDRVQIEFSAGEESIRSVAHLLSASQIDDVQIEGSEIRFGSEFSLFGLPIVIDVGMEPFAAEGEIGFTPTSVSINGARASVADLTDRFGSFADPLFASRSICVAGWLPAALRLETAVIRDDELVVGIGADGRVFTEASLRELGSCPDD